MTLRSLARRIAILMPLAVVGLPAHAAEFVDSAQRHVVLPAHISRVMAAGPAAAVLVYALAPGKLAGWPTPLPRGAAAYLPPRYARLPVTGRLTGPYPTATAASVRWRHPDLIIDVGAISPARIALADRIQKQTGVPYLLVDGSIERTPAVLRDIGALLGVSDRAEDLATYAEHAIMAVRGTLLIRSPGMRPRLYYAQREDGFGTALPGTLAGEEIDESGAINVAAPLGSGGHPTTTRAQLLAWNPNIVIAQDRGFYFELQRSWQWRQLAAVRQKRVYLAPRLPFGWIGDPPGVNRLIGLYWLSALLYPNSSQEDLRAQVVDFYQKFYGVKLTEARLEALVRYAEAKPGETKRAAGQPLYGLGAAPPVPIPSMPGLPAMPRTPGRVAPSRGLPAPMR